MKQDKIRSVLESMAKMTDIIGDTRYRIVIVKDAYFFLVDKRFISRYYEGGHKALKGWYTGILYLKREDFNPHIFISEILYNHEETKALILKILYQILVYLDLDFFKLKYKKFRKHLHRYLAKNLPEEVGYESSCLDSLLGKNVDSLLYRKAEIIIPHMSLYNSIEKLPSSKDLVLYIDDIRSYLQPHEYMTSHHGEHHGEI